MPMSGRLYSMSFSNQTLAAVQDLFALYAGSSRILALQSVNLGQVTGTSVANLRLRIRRLPATVTPGTGGAAGVIVPQDVGDAAATVTGRTNDTTQATSSTTITDLWDDVWNTINGFIWTPPVPSKPPIIGLSQALVVSLDQAPSSFVTNGTIMFEELP